MGQHCEMAAGSGNSKGARQHRFAPINGPLQTRNVARRRGAIDHAVATIGRRRTDAGRAATQCSHVACNRSAVPRDQAHTDGEVDAGNMVKDARHHLVGQRGQQVVLVVRVDLVLFAARYSLNERAAIADRTEPLGAREVVHPYGVVLRFFFAVLFAIVESAPLANGAQQKKRERKKKRLWGRANASAQRAAKKWECDKRPARRRTPVARQNLLAIVTDTWGSHVPKLSFYAIGQSAGGSLDSKNTPQKGAERRCARGHSLATLAQDCGFRKKSYNKQKGARKRKKKRNNV